MTRLIPLQKRYRTPQEKEKYVRDLFSSLEHHYDPMNRYMSLGLDMKWRRKAIRLAGFRENSTLLDMAIGTGDLTMAAFDHVRDASIVGLDFCRPLLLRAEEKLSGSNNHRPVALIQGNGLNMPFKDHYFDGVFTGFSLRNVTDVESLFKEFYRVTKPGGKMVTLEMMRPDNFLTKFIFEIHVKRVVPMLGKLFSEYPDAYTYLPLSIENFYTAAELADLMENTGWKDVIYHKMMFGFIAAHIAIRQ